MIPSKGAQFYWTKNVLHTATTPAAVPTTFPLAGGDTAIWTEFACIMDVSNLDALTAETVKHRCFNPARPLEEDVPTGYIIAQPITMTSEYDTTLETEFRAGKLARTKYRLMINLPLSDTQTTRPDVFAWKVRCTMCEPVLDSGGKPIEMKLEFQLYDDTGVFAPGA